MSEYTLSYTGSEVNEKLKQVDANTAALSELSQEIVDLKNSSVAVTYDVSTKTLNISSESGVTAELVSEIAEKYDVERIVLDGAEIELSQYAKNDKICNVAFGYIDTDNTVILDGVQNDSYFIKYEDWEKVLPDFDSITIDVTETKKEYVHFIQENYIPNSVKKLGIYDSSENKVGSIRAMHKSIKDKRYSFMLISDVHITGADDDDGTTDFIRAVEFAESSNIDFTCVCGDVVDSGTEYVFNKYKNLKAQYTTKQIYEISGNHETYPTGYVTSETLIKYYGNPLYYSFEHDGDVFIMIGEYGWTDNTPFLKEELQFLYECLETNRNKRCFVFQHIFNWQDGDSGNPGNFYSHDIFALSDNNAKQRECFLNLLKHYKNTIWFHGHSHAAFETQTIMLNAIYSDELGYKSIHVPSLAKPKDIVNGEVATLTEESQGYIVDVCKDRILLQGRNFVEGKYLPSAMYAIETPIRTVEANSFVDTTGLLHIGDFVTVTNKLSFVTTNNTSTRLLLNASYMAVLTPIDGNKIDSVNVTMGGIDITNEVYADGTITIAKVTGDIVITAIGIERTVDTTLNWSIGTKIDTSTGAETSSSTYAASNYIEIVSGWTYTLTRTKYEYDAKVCYYDANRKFLSCTSSNLVSIAGKELVAVIPVIETAKYFRIRAYASGTTTPLNESVESTTITATKQKT